VSFDIPFYFVERSEKMANDLKILITGSLNIGKTISEINTALRGIEQKINKININVQVNQTATNALNSLTNQMRTLSSINTARPMQNLSSGLNSVASSAQNAHQHTLTLGSALQQAFQKFPVWLIASTTLFQSFNFLKDGISYVNELNKSLTEISIVTYQSQQQVAALGEQYNKLAQSMGTTTDELSATAAELYRQGLSADQVTSRMKTITEYAKISSLDTKSASEIMTAAINSMGVSAQKAADVWSYLGRQNCPLAS
jgi:hypothetical protein